jgi:hypothetical protein
MRTSTRIAVTDNMSAAYVSPFIQIYLFIRTYMSALVDMMQDYKKCQRQNALYRNQETVPAAGNILSLQETSNGQILQVIIDSRDNNENHNEHKPEFVE